MSVQGLFHELENLLLTCGLVVLDRIGPRLALAHISDTWRDTWAHTSAGRGEVNFPAFAAALTEIGFGGPTVYELVDGEDPEPRLAADLAALAAAGWAP